MQGFYKIAWTQTNRDGNPNIFGFENIQPIPGRCNFKCFQYLYFCDGFVCQFALIIFTRKPVVFNFNTVKINEYFLKYYEILDYFVFEDMRPILKEKWIDK